MYARVRTLNRLIKKPGPLTHRPPPIYNYVIFVQCRHNIKFLFLYNNLVFLEVMIPQSSSSLNSSHYSPLWQFSLYLGLRLQLFNIIYYMIKPIKIDQFHFSGDNPQQLKHSSHLLQSELVIIQACCILVFSELPFTIKWRILFIYSRAYLPIT